MQFAHTAERAAVAAIPDIATILFFAVIPETTETADFGQRKSEAKNSQSAAFALPSTGGAVRATFSAPSKSPMIFEREERGYTRQVIRVQPL